MVCVTRWFYYRSSLNLPHKALLRRALQAFLSKKEDNEVRRDWLTKNVNEGVGGRIHVLQPLAQDSVQCAIFPLWRNRHILQPWMKGKTSFDTSMKIPCFILIHAWSELLLLSWKENNRSQSCQWSASLMMGTPITLSFTSHPWGMAWGSNFRMWFFTYFFLNLNEREVSKNKGGKIVLILCVNYFLFDFSMCPVPKRDF